MARIRRRRRIRCRLPCEVSQPGSRPVRASMVSLSKGGLGLEVALRIDQGEPVRLRILPQRKADAVAVEGIVWNDRPASRAGKAGKLRLLGCVVSDPPAAFLELFTEMERRNGISERQVPTLRTRPAEALPEDAADLPRSREPLPPPKPEPEESLPRFRVRLKQVGGPRSRVVLVRAPSAAQAEERARAELRALAVPGAGGWEVLRAAPDDGG